MGIGLSICNTIVQAHEGRLWAERSKLGGAAFHFTLIDAETEADD
jgi:two-component system sensor kinase FixL